MTDLTPNDLSHLSDEEFNALAPQGYHAPGPATALSPAARAVLDAYWKSPWDPCLQHEDRLAIAAALRAAADQLFPEPGDWDKHNMSQQGLWLLRIKRDQLLAIAAELESADG
jgi:hypothetical protein